MAANRARIFCSTRWYTQIYSNKQYKLLPIGIISFKQDFIPISIFQILSIRVWLLTCYGENSLLVDETSIAPVAETDKSTSAACTQTIANIWQKEPTMRENSLNFSGCGGDHEEIKCHT
jgi:hypothetical protein